MKRNEKKFLNIGAVVFVVALFLVTTVPMSSSAIQGNAEMSNPDIIPNDWDEEDNPPDLPDGWSCIAYTLSRRNFDFWNQIVYSVGFTIKLVRLRDGHAHHWHFNGEIRTKYTKEGNEQVTPLNILNDWSGENYLHFDIVTADTHTEPIFYTMRLVGTGTKDMGSPDNIDRTFYGINYFLDGGQSEG